MCNVRLRLQLCLSRSSFHVEHHSRTMVAKKRQKASLFVSICNIEIQRRQKWSTGSFYVSSLLEIVQSLLTYITPNGGSLLVF